MSAVIQNTGAFSLTGWQRVGRRVVTNQPTGAQWEFLYEGTKANLVPLADNLADKGARITLEIKPGKSTLSALWGYDPGESPETGAPATGETPSDRFELAWEPHQINIFSLPKVIAEAKTFSGLSAPTPGGTSTTSTGAAAYKYVLENAAKNGEPFPFGPVTGADSTTILYNYPTAQYIWENYLAKGVYHWDGSRPVVRRIREYSLTYDITRPTSTVTMTTPVYTRAKLIQEFGIPLNFANRIPLDPTDDKPGQNEIFGWRFRSFHYGYDVGTRKVSESSEWEFASWSRGLYTIHE